ncbi:tungstate transport system ATP-binding protein [Caloramator quimbayensis]|uniref:Tungstate transport system ATP-binding protein n=1 Tax=Caloramator quimbayensis TaxID=1147123 RepID=A0A1T4Y160_9CLOT|nr:ATP-binding cassette domain-containing protein [Caloramator quimbayensis]SKA95005.1 tungstate transport system ATP-binding protein [Caloramator quimbayensis]
MSVRICNIQKTYNSKRVLDIENYHFKENYIYVIRGKNGEGKSTLLNIIAGIEKPDYGEVLYDFKTDCLRYDISMMLQKPYLFNTTVYENIIMGLKYRKINKNEIDKRLKRYCSYFKMGELMNKNAKKLSGGESQRVALLRSAILESKLMLLDEPTSSMDYENTLMAEKLILDMKNKGSTIIMVTHDMSQAKRIGDKIILLEDGRINYD